METINKLVESAIINQFLQRIDTYWLYKSSWDVLEVSNSEMPIKNN